MVLVVFFYCGHKKDISIHSDIHYRVDINYTNHIYLCQSHSYYGYCKSYCRIDYVIPYAVVRGMVTPPDEIEFTNTISGVLCISDTLL